MNFNPLFLSARIVTAIYKIILTAWLLYHLIKRIHGREIPRNGRVSFGGRSSGRYLALADQTD
jgi:hypothetical protein